MQKLTKHSKAFTLIELSVIILIIGIMIAGTFIGSRLIAKSRLAAAESLARSSPVPGIKDNMLWLETSLSASIDSSQENDGAAVTAWYDQSSNSGKPHWLLPLAPAQLTPTPLITFTRSNLSAALPTICKSWMPLFWITLTTQSWFWKRDKVAAVTIILLEKPHLILMTVWLWVTVPTRQWFTLKETNLTARAQQLALTHLQVTSHVNSHLFTAQLQEIQLTSMAF